MKKPKKRGPGTGALPAKRKGTQNWSRGRPTRSGAPSLERNDNLMEQVHQIVDETPDIRPEKVEPLREAVASGNYEIDARKVANALITKIILES
jgi:flagellar biosynthesis anti-sigma factor FlgM